VADLLADIQTEPYSLSVDTAVLLFYLSKEVKQLFFIFLFYSVSGVFHIDLNVLLAFLFENFSSKLDKTPLFGKLECIR
jgi:hypothetical protein